MFKRNKKIENSKSLYKNAFVIINPASGKNEPILNLLNYGFKKYGIEWDVFITKKFGDAKEAASKYAGKDYDLVVSYGGDGTLHEVINGVVDKKQLVGILPGGTGNGFANGLGIPRDTEAALDLMCKSRKTAKIDLFKVGKKYGVSRMYTGIEPEMQTSRQQKDKYGMLAYAFNSFEQAKNTKPVEYNIKIDGKVERHKTVKCYVANSASTGSGISLGDFSPTDGLLDVFFVGGDLKALASMAGRVLKVKGQKDTYYAQGKQIDIKPKKSQPVWIDGELYKHRTPISVKVIPGAVEVIVP